MTNLMNCIRNDEPTLVDLLGRDALVEEMARHVTSCAPPCVFGVHGAWGSGKTSVLWQLHRHLSGDVPHVPDDDRADARLASGAFKDKVRVVWFEAWRHQRDPNPVAALLHEIRAEFSGGAKTWHEAKKLLEVASRGALGILDGAVKGVAEAAEKAGERWEADHFATPLPSHELREQLAKAIDVLLGSKKRRLVVLIDDLDRCEADVAFQLLEGIKIYLNLRNCVFVLGMNEDAIADALEQRWKDTKATSPRVRARTYLEKICAHVWHLPACTNQAGLVAQWSGLDPTHRCVQVVGQFRCLPANPRAIKSWSATLRHVVDVCGQRKEFDERAAVAMAYLQRFEPALYRRLVADIAFFGDIADWSQGKLLRPPESASDRERQRWAPFEDLIHRTHAQTAAPKDAEGGPAGFDRAHPDPIDRRVFWIEALVRDIAGMTTDELLAILQANLPETIT